MKLVLISFLFLISYTIHGNEKVKQKQVAEMFSSYHSQFKDVPILKIEDYKKNQEQYILVDVRSEEERKVSFIPGSISLIEFYKLNKKSRNKKIVTYCTIGYRSGKYAKRFQRSGLDAYNLEGSILGWIHSGGSLIDSQGKTSKKVHIYGPKWNVLPKGYESSY